MEIKKTEVKYIDRVYKLWHDTIGDVWPILKKEFLKRLFKDKAKSIYYKAVKKGEIIGIIIGKYINNKGQVMLIIVRSDYQGKGIGRNLLNRVLEEMKSKGVKRIQLGAGAGSYFWPGVPVNLRGADIFFEKCGWRYSEESVDMIGSIKNYRIPNEVIDGLEVKIRYIVPDKSYKKSILAFEKGNFPNWYDSFNEKIESNQYEDILLACSSSGEIIGSCCLFPNDFIWQKMFDGKVGGFGALGVKKSERGLGIGLALSSKATEALRERGIEYSFLGWTYLIEWYGKLGYKVWREYKMSWRNL